jgi:hypothetical protein
MRNGAWWRWRCFAATRTFAAWRDDGGVAAHRNEHGLFNATGAERCPAARSQRLDDKDYKSALSALYSGGEVTRNADDQYALTKSGRAARQLVEDLTNRNFAVILNIFDQSEVQEFIHLLERVRGPISA